MNDPDPTITAPAETDEERIAAWAALTEDERDTLLAAEKQKAERIAAVQAASHEPPVPKRWKPEQWASKKRRRKDAAASKRKQRR